MASSIHWQGTISKACRILRGNSTRSFSFSFGMTTV